MFVVVEYDRFCFGDCDRAVGDYCVECVELVD